MTLAREMVLVIMVSSLVGVALAYRLGERLSTPPPGVSVSETLHDVEVPDGRLSAGVAHPLAARPDDCRLTLGNVAAGGAVVREIGFHDSLPWPGPSLP